MDKVGQDWQDGESVIILHIQVVPEGPAGEVTWGKRPDVYTRQSVPGRRTISPEPHCSAFTSLICPPLWLPASRQELFERGNDIYSSLGLQFGIWSKCCLYISASPARRSFETLTLSPAQCLEQDSSCWRSCRWNAWSEAAVGGGAQALGTEASPRREAGMRSNFSPCGWFGNCVVFHRKIIINIYLVPAAVLSTLYTRMPLILIKALCAYFMAKVLKHREVKWFSEDHTANNWQSQDVNPRVLFLSSPYGFIPISLPDRLVP